VLLGGLAAVYWLSGLLVLWTASAALGAPAPATPEAPATLATFADVSGVTQEYVDAYNLFVQARSAGNPEHDYSKAVAAFSRIAENPAAPEVQLRSCYFLTLCHFLEGRWSQAFASSEKVLTLAQALHADDPRVALALRLAERAKAGEASLSDVRITLAAQFGADPSLLAAELNTWHTEKRKWPRSPSESAP
jgi:hypothetical protein